MRNQVIEGVVLATEVTEIPRSDLIDEIMWTRGLSEAEAVERLLALGCEKCGGRATTVWVMEADIDRRPRIRCDLHS